MSGAKLPLVVRKSIRDEFDGKKDDLLAKFKDLLEVDYKFEIDFATLYPQCDDGYQQDSIGKICLKCMEDLLDSLKRFTDEVFQIISIRMPLRLTTFIGRQQSCCRRLQFCSQQTCPYCCD